MTPDRHRRTHRLMLTGLVLMTLWLPACAGQRIAQGSVKPRYEAEFLDCVADEVEAQTLGPCVKEAMADWLVQNGM